MIPYRPNQEFKKIMVARRGAKRNAMLVRRLQIAMAVPVPKGWKRGK